MIDEELDAIKARAAKFPDEEPLRTDAENDVLRLLAEVEDLISEVEDLRDLRDTLREELEWLRAEKTREWLRTEGRRATRLFTALSLFVGLVVVGVAAYYMYLHPPDPAPVGTATIEISGTPGVRFKGTVGTLREEHPIEGETPLTFETDYRRADYVVANIHNAERASPEAEHPPPETLKVAIRVGDRVVDERQTETRGRLVDEGQTQTRGADVLVMWKAPRKKP